MADGLGLSVGATNLAAVVVGRTAVVRSPVVTLYPHRPTEVGVPSENPNLNERGLIITDFTERVGDPVPIVAPDGSTHQADALLADALRAMYVAAGRDVAPAEPVAVTHPAHWRPPAVDALRSALAWPVVSDATAALTALQNDPGLPTRGVVALCDFGGTGTSITLADAANGLAPIGPTVRHVDLSGDLVDQALLTHVIDGLSAAGTIDLSGTSAIGSLTRLRAQCRGAKERLSTSAVTSLVAELPGRSSEVRVTRNELDEAIRQPVTDFARVLQETLDRSGIRQGDLAAVASVGGASRVPIITTTLSEHFRVPVITTPQPELTAAIGGGLTAKRGTIPDGVTGIATAAPVAAAAAATQMAPAPDESASSTFSALAWSDAQDLPDVAPSDPYDYSAERGDPRPQVQFQDEPHEEQAAARPWYRSPAVAVGAGALVALAALAAAVLFATRDDSAPSPASTSTVTTTPTTSAAAPPPAEPAPPQTQAPPETRTVTRQAPPPPVTITQAPPPPTSEAPPPPPPTTEAPPPPPTTVAPPTTTQPPSWSPTAPYPTIPGLPWVPAPQLPGQPAQP